MKKILLCIFCLFYGVNAFAASKPTTVYVDTEQKYIFTSENLQETIPDFVEDENKQLEMVRLYQELMNQETGAVSVENLLAVCRAGGFNTYRQAGYAQCRAFVEKLLENAEQEAEEGFFGGFCPPAYDEKGKQINGLKSINETTRVGDFCSSTNIAGGEVVFRKDNGYSCTCAAYACNPGYQSKGGACETIVADGNGNCLRKEYDITTKLNPGEALKFCESKAVRGCKVTNALKNFPEKGKIVCNGTAEELAKVKGIMAENEKRKIANLKYYEVCGDDKGKTGKKEYCVTDYFNWTQTQIGQAIGFAQDYARIKHGATIYCSNNHRTSWNDDYIKCATKDGSVYYEFKFDDVRESIDKDRRLTERSALCRLVGGKVNAINDNKVCKNISDSVCTTTLTNLAKKYGHTVKWENNKCNFVGGLNAEVMKTDAFNDSLAKIEGLDNRAFFEIQVIAVRKNFVLEDEIESYVKKTISGVKKVTCDPGYNTVKVADGVLATIVGNSDDIKRCYVDGKPIDFVFDDLSEIMGYERKAGESGAKCVGNAGKYDGHYCRGLTKSECFELEEKLLSELKRKGWAGDKDLVDWDEKAGACELNDAQFANNINKTGKYTAIVGLTVTGVFTGGSTTAVAVSLMAVELAGIAGEMYTERKKELLPQQWADKFLAQSRNCKSASCAETTLRSNFGKIQQASDMLNRDVLKQVDNELARLAELLPDEKFEQILNSADAPNCWETWECQEKIFMGMQMASLGVAVGKGLVNLTRVIAKKAGKAATKTSTAIVKASTKADDALDIAKGANGATDFGAIGKNLHADLVAARAAKNPLVELAKKYHPDKVASYKSTELSRLAEDIMGRISGKDLAKMTDAELMALSEKMAEFDRLVSALEAERATAVTTTKAADAAEGATNASKGATSASKALPAPVKTTEVVQKSLKEELADIGVREGNVYRDVKTGKIISADEVLRRIDNIPGDDFARIGIKEEKTLTGASRYRDVNTGKFVSSDEVLRRIDDLPSSPSSVKEELAGIGVKQSSSYRDIPSNKFISESEVLRRIDGMPSSTKAAEGATNASRGTTSASKALPAPVKTTEATQSSSRVAASATAKAADEISDAGRVTNTGSKAGKVADEAADVVTVEYSELLRSQASKSFDKYLAEVKTSGKSIKLPKSRLTDDEWKILNQSLEHENVRLIDTGDGYMEFFHFAPYKEAAEAELKAAAGARQAEELAEAERAAQKAAEADRLFNVKFPGFRSYGEGFRVSNQRFSKVMADVKASEIAREGYFTRVVPTKGVSKGEEYVIVAIKQEDAAQFIWDGNNLIKNIDNSAFLRNLNNYTEKEITRIGDTPVFIEDAGSISGRGIVTVRVGEKKIPFYVSTGTAGKTDVPTGKWEVFWGIGKDGWFNKGDLKEILNHYGSSELRQIANALDAKLGDPRDTQLVLETIGRKSQGGVGIVGQANLGHISEDVINSGFISTPGTASNSWRMYENYKDITDYLKGLH